MSIRGWRYCPLAGMMRWYDARGGMTIFIMVALWKLVVLGCMYELVSQSRVLGSDVI